MEFKNGYREAGLDNTVQVFQTAYDLIPTGVQGVGIGQAGTILAYAAPSGTSTVYTIPNGAIAFKVVDVTGRARISPIIVSGLQGQTFNGSDTYTLGENYGTAVGNAYQDAISFVVSSEVPE